MPDKRRNNVVYRDPIPWVSHRRIVVDVDEIDKQSTAEAKALRSGCKPSPLSRACANTRSPSKQTRESGKSVWNPRRSEGSFTGKYPRRNEIHATPDPEFFLGLRSRSPRKSNVQNSEDIPQDVPSRIKMNQDIGASTASQSQAPASVNPRDYGEYSISIDDKPDSPMDKPTEAGWVYADPSLQNRVAGDLTSHEGQRGRWLLSGDPGYPNVGNWVFAPEENQKSRPSRRRPKKRSIKDQTSFLSLPGELRNKIYAQAIPECRVLITATRPNKDLARLRSIWSEEGHKHKRGRTRLFHTLDNSNMELGFEITMALLLSCQKVRDDVEQYLYSRTTFCFDSTKVLGRFLDTASKSGLRAIRKVEIFQQGYSNPENTQDRVFRDRYYAKWLRICTQFGNELTGLEELKLEAILRKWPCEFAALNGSKDICRQAFLQLAPQRLRKVEVKLQHPMIKNNRNVLIDLAHALEDDMMTKEGREARDRWEHEQVVRAVRAKKQAEREAKAKAKREELLASKPLIPLSITKEEIAVQNPVPDKALKKGLEKYHRVDREGMWPEEWAYFQSQYCSQRHKN